jgi:hypothetical protein
MQLKTNNKVEDRLKIVTENASQTKKDKKYERVQEVALFYTPLFITHKMP